MPGTQCRNCKVTNRFRIDLYASENVCVCVGGGGGGAGVNFVARPSRLILKMIVAMFPFVVQHSDCS